MSTEPTREPEEETEPATAREDGPGDPGALGKGLFDDQPYLEVLVKRISANFAGRSPLERIVVAYTYGLAHFDLYRSNGPPPPHGVGFYRSRVWSAVGHRFYSWTRRPTVARNFGAHGFYVLGWPSQAEVHAFLLGLEDVSVTDFVRSER